MTNALDLIAGYKSGELTAVPPRVVVVGAGNTAIDAAIASVRLGASDVHIVYRRGPEQMSAFSFEYEHAKLEGVKFLWHVQPTRILGGNAVEAGADRSLTPRPMARSSRNRLRVLCRRICSCWPSGRHPNRPCQRSSNCERGRILIDRATGQTSNPKFFAGGDCTNGGREVVDAVADGKRAGIGIAAWLEGHAHA